MIDKKNISSFFNIRYLGLAGMVGSILFLLVFVLLHILDIRVNFLTNNISEYAHGAYSWIFFYSLIIHGIGNIAISIALMKSLIKSKFGRIGSILFGISSMGIIIGAFFIMDIPGTVSSLEGKIHIAVVAISLILEAVALFFFFYAFKNIPAWKKFSLKTIRTTVFGSIFLFIFAVSVIIQIFSGFIERVVFLIFLFWEIMISIYIFINFYKIIK